MMHRLLSLFRLLLIATPGALRIIEIYVTSLMGKARFVFLKSVSASLGIVWERLGTVWIVLERFVSAWDRLGTVWSVLGASGSV